MCSARRLVHPNSTGRTMVCSGVAMDGVAREALVTNPHFPTRSRDPGHVVSVERWWHLVSSVPPYRDRGVSCWNEGGLPV